MLDHADRGRPVVHVPRGAAIIKVDHGRPIAIDKQVCEAEVVVGQSESVPAAPVGIEPTADHVFQACQKRELLLPHAETVLPAAGATLRADELIAVPRKTRETRGPTPSTGMPMHARADRPQATK